MKKKVKKIWNKENHHRISMKTKRRSNATIVLYKYKKRIFKIAWQKIEYNEMYILHFIS